MNCDALAMMCVLDPDFSAKEMNCHGSCITNKGETLGQVIFYQKGFIYDVADTSDYVFNLTLVNEVRSDEYFERFLNAITQ
ncbi:hypothetical protein QYZ88_013110 [Lachnospiraceae bacterium C1.1]|nr:hypothetical protein [Lachnospiraceae bacterium C1.1]